MPRANISSSVNHLYPSNFILSPSELTSSPGFSPFGTIYLSMKLINLNNANLIFPYSLHASSGVKSSTYLSLVRLGNAKGWVSLPNSARDSRANPAWPPVQIIPYQALINTYISGLVLVSKDSLYKNKEKGFADFSRCRLLYNLDISDDHENCLVLFLTIISSI